MTEAGLQRVMESMQELERRQTMPDSPEALASIPSLSLADLDKRIRTIPISVDTVDGAPIVYHDLFTNGITYVDVGFDLHALPQPLLPYAGLLGDLWLGMGTHAMDYVRMSQRIGQRTGGIGATAVTTAVRSGGPAATWLFLRAKATVAETPALFEILHDITTDVRLDDRERFRQIVLAARSDLEAGLLPSGHSYVYSRLRSHFGEADWLSEQLGVSSQLFFRALADRIDQDWPGVLADLQAVQNSLVNRGAMLCNITVDQAGYTAVSGNLADFVSSLPRHRAPAAVWRPELDLTPEGLTIPAQVNFVGKGANLYVSGYRSSGAVQVVLNVLRLNWLWEKVRMQGGAYGVFAQFDDVSGMFSYLSYRDPNLLGTLESYDGAGGFLRTVELSQDDLTKAIIGAIGAIGCLPTAGC